MTTMSTNSKCDQIFISKNVKTVQRELALLLSTSPGAANVDVTMCMAGGRMIIGESGIGKSTALVHALNYLGANIHALDHTQKKPILLVSAHAKITLSTLSAQVHDSLGLTAPPARDTAAMKLSRAIKQMQTFGTKVLVVDEAQHLVSQKRNDETYVAADGIKTIMNAGIAVLLVGTKDATELLVQNEQLRRRMGGAVTLTNWGDNEGANNMEMSAFIKYFFEKNGMQSPDCFKNPKVYEAVCVATKMNISYTMYLLGGAIRIAKQAGRSSVMKTDIEQSFVDYAQPKSDARNPFCKGFNGVPLLGKGELFYTGGKQ